MTIKEKLFKIQQELNVPKGQHNDFGGYYFRSCEDILTAVKPLLKDLQCILTLEDELVYVGERYYIKATAQLIDLESDVVITNTAYAREEETKKGMDASQITGASSSYARKYALNGLFGIDDVKDSDTTNTHDKDENRLVSDRQLSLLEKIYTGDNLEKVLKKYEIDDLSQMPFEIGKVLIGKNINKKKKEQEEVPSNGWMDMQE